MCNLLMRLFVVLILILPVLTIDFHLEEREFTAEVNEMMKIIINSLYQKKEIFLRELISNASDALDKLRILSFRNMVSVPQQWQPNITIRAYPETGILEVRDTGLGMSREELISNLGTIAKSGTKAFVKYLDNNQDVIDQIGKFGVGFYSVFLVSDSVEVVTKSANETKQIWSCNISDGKYSIRDAVNSDDCEEPIVIGTKIMLKMRNDTEIDYFDTERLEELVKQYSEFIGFPIYVYKNVSSTIDIDESELSENQNKTNKTTVWNSEYVMISRNKPIWMKTPKEISEDEYNEFYRQFFREYEDPFGHIHFRAETVDTAFNGMVYVPRTPTFQPFTKDEPSKFLKLYVKKVLISDNISEEFPRYLAFIKGIVDAEDVPLNVSREILQKSRVLNDIKTKVASKTLDLLKQFARNETLYNEFYQQYSGHIKLGVMIETDSSRRNELARLLRYRNSHGQELVSIDDYLGRSKLNQTEIYFVSGPNYEVMQKLPYVEGVLRKGYEVLYMTDPYDEHVVQAILKYNDRPFRNLAKAGIQLPDDGDEKNLEEFNQQLQPLIQYMEKLLEANIQKVVVSLSLDNAPIAIVSAEYGWSASMEKLMSGHNDPMSKFFLSQKRVVQLNPRHSMIQSLLESVKSNQSNVEDDIRMLYDLALISSGYDLRDPVEFVNRVVNLTRIRQETTTDRINPEL